MSCIGRLQGTALPRLAWRGIGPTSGPIIDTLGGAIPLAGSRLAGGHREPEVLGASRSPTIPSTIRRADINVAVGAPGIGRGAGGIRDPDDPIRSLRVDDGAGADSERQQQEQGQTEMRHEELHFLRTPMQPRSQRGSAVRTNFDLFSVFQGQLPVGRKPEAERPPRCARGGYRSASGHAGDPHRSWHLRRGRGSAGVSRRRPAP